MTSPPSARRTITPDELAFATMYGLPPYLASLLASLYRGDPTEANRRHIASLRTALEPEAIDTTDEGYHLTDIGRDECKEALELFGAWVNGRATA